MRSPEADGVAYTEASVRNGPSGALGVPSFRDVVIHSHIIAGIGFTICRVGTGF